MARSDPKDRKRKDLRSLDSDQSDYWEEVLRREGLSMNRGTSRYLVGKSRKKLEAIEHGIVSDGLCGPGGGRRVHPKGSGPDD